MRQRPGTLRRAIAALALLSLLAVAACDDGGDGGTNDPDNDARPKSTGKVDPANPFASCGELPTDQQTVIFTTSDDVTIVGMLFGEGTTGIVLSHSLGSDLCEWLPEAERWADDYTVLAINLRGSPPSQEVSGPIEFKYSRDVEAAAFELQNRGVLSVVAIGASVGGTAAMEATVLRRGGIIHGVVALSSPSSFEAMDGTNALVSRPTALRMVVAEEDPEQRVGGSEDVVQAATTKDKKILVVPGSEHGTELFEGEAADEIREFIDDFLASIAAQVE